MDLSDTNSIYKLFETEKFDAVCNLAAQLVMILYIENPQPYIDSKYKRIYEYT